MLTQNRLLLLSGAEQSLERTSARVRATDRCVWNNKRQLLRPITPNLQHSLSFTYSWPTSNSTERKGIYLWLTISRVAKYTAKEALLIILHKIYLGFVYPLIRRVSLCFLHRAGAVALTKGLLFVFFLFVLLIFCSAYGLRLFTDRKYFPHLGKGNSLWRKFKASPLGSDLPVHSVISYSWTETSELFLASNSSAAINTSLLNSHLAVDFYTRNRGCLLLSWSGSGRLKKGRF